MGLFFFFFVFLAQPKFHFFFFAIINLPIVIYILYNCHIIRYMTTASCLRQNSDDHCECCTTKNVVGNSARGVLSCSAVSFILRCAERGKFCAARNGGRIFVCQYCSEQNVPAEHFRCFASSGAPARPPRCWPDRKTEKKSVIRNVFPALL